MQLQEKLTRVLDNIDKVLVGRRKAAQSLLAAVLAGGHVLIEDKPGVGKTMLVKALARSIDCEFSRIQFNADILPGDITGMEVYTRDGEKKFVPGPIMANLVLVDEVNRGNPRAQAGLLEAMEEKQVTVMGKRYPLAEPFCVLATQNPMELAGTYPLSEGLVDRFMLRLSLGYPDAAQEVAMLNLKEKGEPLDKLQPVVDAAVILEAREAVHAVYVESSVKQYIVDIVRAIRSRKELKVGVSPRATLDLYQLSRARAFLQGRDYVMPDDVKALAYQALAHRIFLTNEAAFHGITVESLLEAAVTGTPVPVARR